MDIPLIISAGLTAALGVTGATFALSAIGLNLQYGYTGLINFGHVAFMLVGAYGFAITHERGGPTWLGVVVGMAAAAVLALLMGIPTLRLRGDYLAIVTIATAEMLRLLVNSRWLQPVTNGPLGIQGAGSDVVRANPVPRGRYGWSAINLDFTARQLWLMAIAWGLVAIAMIAMWRLIRSPWGRMIRAIRDDEAAVRSVGKNVFAYKMQALVVGGMFGALAGMVLALDRQHVAPNEFLPLITFYTYVIIILGGAGSIWGPLFGAMTFWFLLRAFETFLSQAVGEGWFGGLIADIDVGPIRWASVGVGLMLLMIFRPQGFFGSRQEQLISAR